MIVIQWIGAAMLVGAAVVAAALVLERACAGIAARRFVWAGAVVAALVLPVGLSLNVPAEVAPALTEQARPTLASAGESRLGTVALGAWALLSLAVLGNLIAGFRSIRRHTRDAQPVDVFGHRVYLCDFGPAVVGFVRPRAMIPRWVSELSAEDQKLIVAHEAEHVASGDQLLLLAGLATVVLMPWNPAAWVALNRLRNAIELDCDARVAAGTDAVRYGSVLLEARLRGPIAPVFNLAFARPAIRTRVESLLSPYRASRMEILGRTVASALVISTTLFVAVPPIAMAGAEPAAPPAGTYRIIGEQRGDTTRPAGTVPPAQGAGNRPRFTPRAGDSTRSARPGATMSRARLIAPRPDTVTPF